MKPGNKRYLLICTLIVSTALFAGCQSGAQKPIVPPPPVAPVVKEAPKDAKGVIKRAVENFADAKSVSSKIVMEMGVMGMNIRILDCDSARYDKDIYAHGELIDGSNGLTKTPFEYYSDDTNAVMMDPADKKWALASPAQKSMILAAEMFPAGLNQIPGINQDALISKEEKIGDKSYQVIELTVNPETINDKAFGGSGVQGMAGKFDKVTIKMWVAKDAYLLSKVILDMEGKAAGAAVKMKMEMNYSNYDKGDAIVIPPEAKELLAAPDTKAVSAGTGTDSELTQFKRRAQLSASEEEVISKAVVKLASLKIPELYNKYVDLDTFEVLDYDVLIERLKDIRVVYVAESHTNSVHHKFQEKVLESLAQKNPKAVLAMEFLYRSKQQVCDDYIAGKITESEFDKAVRAGFSNEWYELYYVGLVRYAKENGLKLLGLNVEKEIKNKLVDEGWDKLTPAEQKLIAKDIDTSNKAHREFVMKSFEEMKKMSPKFNEDRMYVLQCVWDETFGEAIANYLKAADNPASQVIVVAGAGHIEYKFNIPERSYKRYPATYKTLIPVSITEKTADKEGLFREALSSYIGDFIYFAPPDKGE
ncbi:MAG: ChaN family lipoprotein [Candidatus Brocadiia bacterium]